MAMHNYPRHLPQELIELILQHVSSISDLKACALASGTWREAAARELFSSLTLLCTPSQQRQSDSNRPFSFELGIISRYMRREQDAPIQNALESDCDCEMYLGRTVQKFISTGAVASPFIVKNVKTLRLVICSAENDDNFASHPHLFRCYDELASKDFSKLLDQLPFTNLRQLILPPLPSLFNFGRIARKSFALIEVISFEGLQDISGIDFKNILKSNSNAFACGSERFPSLHTITFRGGIQSARSWILRVFFKRASTSRDNAGSLILEMNSVAAYGDENFTKASMICEIPSWCCLGPCESIPSKIPGKSSLVELMEDGRIIDWDMMFVESFTRPLAMKQMGKFVRTLKMNALPSDGRLFAFIARSFSSILSLTLSFSSLSILKRYSQSGTGKADMVYLNSLAELQTLILKLSLPGFISMRTPPKNHSISGGADVPASTVSKVVDELDLIFFELFNRSAHPQIFLEIETTSTTSPVEPLPKRIHPSSMNVRLIPSPKE